jgi:peptide deformylase
MAVKSILTFPEFASVLQAVATAVPPQDSALAALLANLADTLQALPHAIGVAAPQIGVSKRVFVLKKKHLLGGIDPAYAPRAGEVLYFVNPKIIAAKGGVQEEEGCLSLPGEAVLLERSRVVKVRAINERGKQFYERFEGLAARAIQQEMDHLDGILIIDRKNG